MAALGRWLDRPGLRFVALLLAMLCLMPPDGALSDNEEFYFQIAAHNAGAAPALPESALFDNSRHRIVADHLLGWLIAAAGYGGAQIIARALAACAYALALGAVLGRFGLGTLESLLVIIVFALMGQTLFGGEWLFAGAEAKVAAYALVLAALARVMAGGSLPAAAVLLAAATYFHFLVGGFWLIAGLSLALILDRRRLSAVGRSALLYFVLVGPLVFLIVTSERGMAAAPQLGQMPSPDVIYSLIRAPHHTSPFIDGDSFLHQWLPGYLLGAGMLVTALAGWRLAAGPALRRVALWLALLLGYLFLVLLPVYFDRDTGQLGKFYPFRPAALVLLLWLGFVLAWLGELGFRNRLAPQLCALALVVPLFLLGSAVRIAGERAARRALPPAIAAAIRSAPPTGAVLIDPQLEFAFLDFERRLGRPMLIAWKFDPATPADIVEWYRRMQFREAIFARGCGDSDAYSVAFLLTTREHAARLAPSCGGMIATADDLALLQRRR
jgi:hypothetical protein